MYSINNRKIEFIDILKEYSFGAKVVDKIEKYKKRGCTEITAIQ